MAANDFKAQNAEVRLTGTLHPAPEMSPAHFFDWYRRWLAAEVDHRARIAEIHASFKRKGDGIDNALLNEYIRRLEQVRDGGLDERQWDILRQRIEAMERFYEKFHFS